MTGLWIAFLLYSLAAVGLGFRASRRQREGDDFWTAGRELGSVSVGLSISAGFLSVSWSCVYAVQLFYWYGLGAVWLITVPWLLALAGIWLLARRYNELSAFSQPEMVGQRFGRPARRAVATALLFVFLTWGGAEIYVAANLLAPAMGVGTGVLILLISGVVALYATLGGFGAVVATDKLQYAIVALYILVMAGLAAHGLSEVEGGWQQWWAQPPTGAKMELPWTTWIGPGVATILLTLVAYLPGWIFETDLWLRVQAARSPVAARRGVLIAAANGLLFVGLLPLFIGTAGLVLFPMEGAAFPAALGFEGDALFAALVERFAPAWLAVAVGVGLVAAAMSTIDTCVNVVALSVAYDWMAPTDPESPPRDPRAQSRWVTGLAVAAAALFAFFTESLWDLFYLSSGVLTAAVAFPVAAIFLPSVRRRAVLASSIVGFAATLLFYFLETRGLLGWEPAWLAETGVGFILFGVAAAAVAAAVGQWSDTEASEAPIEPE